MRKKKENTKELVDSRLAALGFALLLRHLFVDRINLSLGVTVFFSERAPGLMMQLLQQLHSLLLQTRH